MDAPRREERLERALLRDRQIAAIRVGGLGEDVQVADGAEPRRDLAETPAMSLRPALPEGLSEDPPRGALATGRHPHRMEILGIAPVAGALLLGDHPGEVEPEHLPAGFREVIVGQDAGGLADGEAGSVVGLDGGVRAGPRLRARSGFGRRRARGRVLRRRLDRGRFRFARRRLRRRRRLRLHRGLAEGRRHDPSDAEPVVPPPIVAVGVPLVAVRVVDVDRRQDTAVALRPARLRGDDRAEGALELR